MFKLIGVVACVAVLGAGVGVAASAPGSTAGTIVYHARLKGSNNEIFVVNPKSGVAMRLTRNRASDSNPTWSANGARIVAIRPWQVDVEVGGARLTIAKPRPPGGG